MKLGKFGVWQAVSAGFGESLVVVVDGEESGFDVYFFQSAEHVAFEVFVLFEISENRFDFPSLVDLCRAFFARKQFFHLFSMPVEVVIYLDDAVLL